MKYYAQQTHRYNTTAGCTAQGGLAPVTARVLPIAVRRPVGPGLRCIGGLMAARRFSFSQSEGYMIRFMGTSKNSCFSRPVRI